MFHGEEASCKNEVSFEQWVFKVRSVQEFNSEPVVREAIIKSLEGTKAM